MTPENKNIFFAHALQNMPRESCALLVVVKGHESLQLCKNIADQKEQFVIDPKDYLAAKKKGEIIGVVHSHVFISSRPSQADLVGCEATGVPWFICSVPTGSWFEFKPSDFKAPLIGRQFHHGVLDCYSLIRDYYRDVLNVEIPDFERASKWWEKGENLYLDNFKKAGFFEIKEEELRAHDVMLMQIHADVPNHGGVYLGNNVMLHHLMGRLSCREVFGGYYKKHTVKMIRHETNQIAR